MSLPRHLVLSIGLLVIGAAIGCANSETYKEPMPGTGGSPPAGSGGATADTGGGSGGAPGSGGSMGSGGALGTGGMVAPVDAPKDTVTAMDTPPEMGGGMLTFAKDVMPILSTACGGCHGAAGGAAGMTATMLASVTGTVSAAHTNCAKVDPSKKRIVAGNPMASYLYQKITAASATALGANCGNPMPAGGGTLTAAQKMTIMTWIMQGAM
jgi:hypothetical protein